MYCAICNVFAALSTVTFGNNKLTETIYVVRSDMILVNHLLCNMFPLINYIPPNYLSVHIYYETKIQIILPEQES